MLSLRAELHVNVPLNCNRHLHVPTRARGANYRHAHRLTVYLHVHRYMYVFVFKRRLFKLCDTLYQIHEKSCDCACTLYSDWYVMIIVDLPLYT